MAEGDSADAIGVADILVGSRGSKGSTCEGEGDGNERGFHFDGFGWLFVLVETKVGIEIESETSGSWGFRLNWNTVMMLLMESRIAARPRVFICVFEWLWFYLRPSQRV